MTLASMLAIDFTQFGLVEWIVVGVLALLVLISFIVGCKKGFSNLSLRPVSWAAACAVFVILNTNFYQVGVDMFVGMGMADPALAGLLSSVLWVVAAVAARGIVFGLIAGLISCSKGKKHKKAAKAAYAEKYSGEEVLPDENKAYKTAAINGKIKPGPLNRLFGGIFGLLNVAVVVAIIVSIVFFVLYMTPLNEVMEFAYSAESEWNFLWQFVQAYLVDFIAIALFCTIVVKGFRVGFLTALRNVICAFATIVVVVGAFYLPFVTEFMITGAENLAALIPLTETVGMDVMRVVMQILFGIVMAIVGSWLVKLIAWILGKIVEAIDKVTVLWVIDGVIGAILYAVFAFAIIYAIALVGYSIIYLCNLSAEGIFNADSIFRVAFFNDNSIIMKGFYEMFNSTTSSSLHDIWENFHPVV